MVQPCSPADLWQDRLNQIAHRAASLGWLLLVGVAFPAKMPALTIGALALFGAIVSTMCSVLATVLGRSHGNSARSRESGGVFWFSLLLLVAVNIIELTLKIPIRQHLASWFHIKPHVLSALALEFVNPSWLRWIARVVPVLVGLVVIVTLPRRRGRA
ncbi:MAG: hypothetical protein ABSH20_05310 [Tepidisphaeraceae bacterium]|jgi:hypothetical protein